MGLIFFGFVTQTITVKITLVVEMTFLCVILRPRYVDTSKHSFKTIKELI